MKKENIRKIHLRLNGFGSEYESHLKNGSRSEQTISIGISNHVCFKVLLNVIWDFLNTYRFVPYAF